MKRHLHSLRTPPECSFPYGEERSSLAKAFDFGYFPGLVDTLEKGSGKGCE